MAEDSWIESMGKTVGTGVASGVAGQAMNMVFGGIQDKRQRKQQRKLNDINYDANVKNMDYQQQKQLENWERTGYGAQVKQMEEAGLNPAMIYGSGGGGGATMGSVSGGGSAASAGDPNAGVGMGVQMASQIAMMQAQTEKIKAETENLKGNTENTTVDTAGKELKNKGQEIENYIKQATQGDTVSQIAENARKAMYDAQIAGTASVVSEGTQKSQIQRIEANAIGAMIENELNRSKIAINRQEIQRVITDLQQKQEAIDISRNVQEQNKANQEALVELGKLGLSIQGAKVILEGVKSVSSRRVGGIQRSSKTTEQYDGNGNLKGTSHTSSTNNYQ